MIMGGAYAQNGMIFGMNQFQTTDMLSLSRFDYSLSTARSRAMGGAFASLGADLSSMSINPAGLAMYRGGEVGITTTINSTHVNVRPLNGNSFAYRGENFRTKLTLDNLGFTVNGRQSSGALTSVQWGFGYNKLADLNYRHAVETTPDQYSVGELFVEALNGFDYGQGMPLSWLPNSARPFRNNNIDPWYWNSILAYKTFMVDGEEVGFGSRYFINDQSTLSPDDMKSHYSYLESEGSIGEYLVSGAFNFRNRVYFGFSLSLLSIWNEKYFSYEEEYPRYPQGPHALYKMQYNQAMSSNGVGFGAKIGVIVRPIDPLRIGLAFHTPQMVTLNTRYRAEMYTRFTMGLEPGYSNTDNLEYDYEYSSPPRLLAGISYTFGNWGILSADYEAVWYNGMRSMDSDMGYRDLVRGNVKADFKTAHNFRIGAEVKPLPALALRGGLGFMGSALKDELAVFDNPAPFRSYIASAGIGWRSKGGTSVDFTYTFNRTSQSVYDQYYDAYYDGGIYSGDIKTYLYRNFFTLSLSQRF